MCINSEVGHLLPLALFELTNFLVANFVKTYHCAGGSSETEMTSDKVVHVHAQRVFRYAFNPNMFKWKQGTVYILGQ